MNPKLRLSLLCGSVQAADKPNIIVIFTDDHGWADLGANGADPHIRTSTRSPSRVFG